MAWSHIQDKNQRTNKKNYKHNRSQITRQICRQLQILTNKTIFTSTRKKFLHYLDGISESVCHKISKTMNFHSTLILTATEESVSIGIEMNKSSRTFLLQIFVIPIFFILLGRRNLSLRHQYGD